MIIRIRHFLRPRPVANNGSQLRDHLANERTFLSWTRMGLAFAAIALGLGRLGIIDQVLTSHWKNEPKQSATEAVKSTESREQRHNTDTQKSEFQLTGANDIFAGKLCWLISSWSFGYGILRYVSIRQTLLSGRFVPAIWGPVLLTCSSVGSLGILLQEGNGHRYGATERYSA